MRWEDFAKDFTDLGRQFQKAPPIYKKDSEKRKKKGKKKSKQKDKKKEKVYNPFDSVVDWGY